jgi:hypothetical protein
LHIEKIFFLSYTLIADKGKPAERRGRKANRPTLPWRFLKKEAYEEKGLRVAPLGRAQ